MAETDHSEGTPRARPLIQWQLPMQRVLMALAPLALVSVYLFGWRVLALLVVTNATAFVTEYLFVRRWDEPVTSAVFVSGSLLALSCPPTLPLWMAAVGSAFGVGFGKMVFGGFGRNVFNPALVGRAFIYVNFPVPMTAAWAEPLRGTTDAVTSASPLVLLRGAAEVPWRDLVLGTTAGSSGETCALLVLLGGCWIVWKRAASWRIVAGGLLGFLLVQTALWHYGVERALHPAAGLLAGGFLFGLFFFATDPVSAAQTDPGRWVYGALCGALTVLIRTYSAWPEGTMFAVLLGNMFAPITDHAVRELAGRGGAA